MAGLKAYWRMGEIKKKFTVLRVFMSPDAATCAYISSKCDYKATL